MRSRARGCTVQIDLWNGDPGGIRVLSCAGWDGYLLVVPRKEVDNAGGFDEELNRAGTVVLLGQTDNQRVCLRITHAEPASRQLAIFRAEARWTHMFLLGREGDFPRIVARQVALRLIQAARRSGLADVVETYPVPPKSVTAAIRSTVDSYTREALTLLALGGADLFGDAGVIASSPRKPAVDVPVPHPPSTSVGRTGPEQTEPRRLAAPTATVEPGGALRFQNSRYSSPSGAAVAATGISTNGWTAWHTTDGRALDDLRRKVRKRNGKSQIRGRPWCCGPPGCRRQPRPPPPGSPALP